MKGPVAPTTSLSSRVEKVKAERDAIEKKKQKICLEPFLQDKLKFFGHFHVETVFRTTDLFKKVKILE